MRLEIGVKLMSRYMDGTPATSQLFSEHVDLSLQVSFRSPVSECVRS
jgi:hypothetical protein